MVVTVGDSLGPRAYEAISPTILEWLTSAEGVEQRMAKSALESLGKLPPTAFPALQDALKSPNWGIRGDACDLLSLLEPVPDEIDATLTTLLRDKKLRLQVDAMKVSASLKRTALVPVIREFFASENSSIRLEAAKAISQLVPGDPECAKVIVGTVPDSYPSQPTQDAVAALNKANLLAPPAFVKAAMSVSILPNENYGHFSLYPDAENEVQALFKRQPNPAALAVEWLSDPDSNRNLQTRLLRWASHREQDINFLAKPLLVLSQSKNYKIREASLAELQKIVPLDVRTVVPLARQGNQAAIRVLANANEKSRAAAIDCLKELITEKDNRVAASESLASLDPSFESLVITTLITALNESCLLYTSPSPRDKRQSRMPSSA